MLRNRSAIAHSLAYCVHTWEMSVVLEAFCRAYAERGFWKIVSRSFPENTASLALHERCGFRVGVYKRDGKLEGAWRDCVIVERLLDES